MSRNKKGLCCLSILCLYFLHFLYDKNIGKSPINLKILRVNIEKIRRQVCYKEIGRKVVKFRVVVKADRKAVTIWVDL